MIDPRDKLPENYFGPWIATFRDGPCAEADGDRVFTVGPIWREMRLAPMPETPSRPAHWVLVGGDQLMEIENTGPAPPWPGEVTYTLTDVITMAGADGEPVAYYEQASSQP